ncbi:hypothetical protein ABS768_04610 [Flavobacterium sp. ST-75]|uniref:YubB ferredoxin-like domain-containing protein n=1 Tax=Flavobacterium rhizophilum TaxID=3163296 RepID=A0ABW8Y9T6_9FLAO
MANLCSNYLVFEGNQKTIKTIHELFQHMKEREEKTGHGQLPEFLSDQCDYFFDLYWDDGEVGTYQYTTRWAPNTEVVKLIAMRCGADFTLEYEEMGCLVYGRTTFINGIMRDICLENEDFDAYLWDEEEDTYRFEGKTYYSQWEILDTLLERRWAQAAPDPIADRSDP